MSIVTRFAPSPTGHLHLGSAYAALIAWRRARDAGGRFLLRLEDIDTSRCRPEFTVSVLEDLAWLGLDWDGPVRVQTEHLPEYRGVLAVLSARGLLYRCFCTRGDIARAATAPHGPDGPVYPGTCRHLPPDANPGQPHVLRLDVARALAETGPLTLDEEGQGRLSCNPTAFGDIVLARRETPCSYHLCVTHDDAVQGVTLVTRGADLLPATSIHRLLQALMDWPEPSYHHHAVLTDASGRRLAKRDQATTIRSMRWAGLTPGAVLARVEQICPGGAAPTRAEV
jgi:glutamyl-Q tRNA(Asp) synthetase